MYFWTSSSSDSLPCCAARATLIAVNTLEIDASANTVSGVACTPSSRFAIPAPCSYTDAPFRRMPTAQPGESLLFHAENSVSTCAVFAPAASDRWHAGQESSAITPTRPQQEAMRVRIGSILHAHSEWA